MDFPHQISRTNNLCLLIFSSFVAQYNINQMIQAGVQNKQAFLCLIQDINFFEFEDRKKIQQIVTELLASSNGNNELVFTMRGSAGSAILKQLLSMYNDIDNVSFMGEYLRMFTVYPALLPCWYNLVHIGRELALNTQLVCTRLIFDIS